MSQPPIEIKAPKAYEIINWVLGNNPVMPEHWMLFKTSLDRTVPYLTEQFWRLPKITSYLNKHLNSLHNIPDSIEAILILRKVAHAQQVTKFDLYQTWPEFKPKLHEAIADMDLKDTNDAAAKAMMMNYFNVPMDKYIKPQATKANITKNSDPKIKIVITKALEEKEVKDNAIDESRDVFIKELTQEVIDTEELVLFDVSLLKKTNRILFIFIDKNNHKKYHMKPFMAKIFLSNEDCVINNDYIEELTPGKFSGFILKDVKLYMKLKYMLNDSYKRIVNGIHN